MGFLGQFMDALGIKDTPWIMRVYFALLIVCVGLIVFAAVRLDGTNSSGPMLKLFEFAMDNFKLVLGAVIGSLSTAATAQWGRPPRGGRQVAGRQGDGQ